MSRYVRVENRTWADEKVRALSRPQPNAQSLFLYLLTGPHAEGPGCFEAGAMDAFGWSLSDVRACYGEIARAGLARFDPKTGELWIAPGFFGGYVDRRRDDEPRKSAARRAWENVSDRVRKVVLERDGRRCVLCGSTNHPEVDHIIALANGGSNDLTNLQTLCRPCNRRKGAR